jgi:hypothetical protein
VRHLHEDLLAEFPIEIGRLHVHLVHLQVALGSDGEYCAERGELCDGGEGWSLPGTLSVSMITRSISGITPSSNDAGESGGLAVDEVICLVLQRYVQMSNFAPSSVRNEFLRATALLIGKSRLLDSNRAYTIH